MTVLEVQIVRSAAFQHEELSHTRCLMLPDELFNRVSDGPIIPSPLNKNAELSKSIISPN